MGMRKHLRVWLACIVCIVCIVLSAWVNNVSARRTSSPSWARTLFMLKHPYWRVKERGLCILLKYYRANRKAVPFVLKILAEGKLKDPFSTNWRLRLIAARWLFSVSNPKIHLRLLDAVVYDLDWRFRLGLLRILCQKKCQVKSTLLLLKRDKHPAVRKLAKQLYSRKKVK